MDRGKIPFCVGKDDYTKRLFYYVEHTIKSIPMYIDNTDRQLGFIRSDEAGKFMAFLVDQEIQGAVNGCAHGTISLQEIIQYVEKKTGTKAILDNSAEHAPYNGTDTEKAEAAGFRFSALQDWIDGLLDDYIRSVV